MPSLTKEVSDSAWQLADSGESVKPGVVPAVQIWRLDGGGFFRVRYRDGTEFLIDGSGSRIWVTCPDSLTLEDTMPYLHGAIFAFVLRLRGICCLHASDVAVGDRAVVLLGPGMAGKSTTAAAFGQLGYPVMSDDIVALGERGDGFIVRPGVPCLRLWPESVRTLFGVPDALPRLAPSWEKHYLDLGARGFRFETRPPPPAAIYVLGERREDSSGHRLEYLTAHDGLLKLVANAHPNRVLDA